MKYFTKSFFILPTRNKSLKNFTVMTSSLIAHLTMLGNVAPEFLDFIQQAKLLKAPGMVYISQTPTGELLLLLFCCFTVNS